jgi:Transposase
LANTCGIDWSERHHNLAIVDPDGAVVARTRVRHDITGFGQLVALLAEHAPEPNAIESNKRILKVETSVVTNG